MNRTLPIAAFFLLALVRPWPRFEAPAPLAPERELASLVPERCRIYVEASSLQSVLALGLEHPFAKALRASALGQALLEAAPGAPEQALARADAWLGEPVLPALADLTRRGLALGFDPAAKKAVLVALGSSAQDVEQRLATSLDALERQYGWPGALDAPQARSNGAELWYLGDQAVVARRGELLVLGNDRELVAETLALAADPLGRGLLDRPGFEAHHETRPRTAALWAWLELKELEATGDEGYRNLRAANRTPAAQSLLGAELSALTAARALSLALTLDGTGLVLTARGFDAPVAATLAPAARAGAVPAEVGGTNVGSALLYRDYARFLTGRAELFPAEAQAGFAEALTNGALFFEGQDLGADVLPHLSPWIRLVSREVAFAPERAPEIPLPALAVVAVLDESQGDEWAAAFQTLLAVLNVDRAQKGGKGLRLYLEDEDGIEISAARFAAPAPSDGIDARYNLEPALAVVGRHLVIGTHVALVRDLARELRAAQPGAAGEARETLELSARGLQALVEKNRAVLVAKKMLEDGLERAVAAEKIEGLRLALASLERLRVELDGRDPSAPELTLTLTFPTGEGAR